MPKYLTYIIEFILGGSVIVGMHLLSDYVNPKYAGLLYALPVQFTVAAFFIYLGSDHRTVQELSVGTAISLLALVLFLVVFYLLTKKFSFYLSLSISYAVFIIAGFLLVKYVLK